MNQKEKMKQRRKEMVDKQLKKRGINDDRVLNAFLTVPRHSFVPEDRRGMAYEDGPLPIGEGQTISQPYIVAEMIQALHLDENDSVLEVGTGSGYATAILSRIVDEVFSIERFQVLAEKADAIFQTLGYNNIEIKTGDGTEGWPEKAPFSAILVSAAAPEIPVSLKLQLKKGGYLVLPVGDRNVQKLIQIRNKDGENFSKKSMGMVRFVPLVGKEGWEKEDNRKW